MIPNIKIKKDSFVKAEAQKLINDVYGKGQWELITYKGGHHPCLVKHKCGEEKEVSRYSTFKLGTTKCKCQHENSRRPQTSFEEVADRVNRVTNGEYQLVSYNGANNMVIRHNVGDCMREFPTTTSRFFNRCQRCACVVGRV